MSRPCFWDPLILQFQGTSCYPEIQCLHLPYSDPFRLIPGLPQLPSFVSVCFSQLIWLTFFKRCCFRPVTPLLESVTGSLFFTTLNLTSSASLSTPCLICPHRLSSFISYVLWPILSALLKSACLSNTPCSFKSAPLVVFSTPLKKPSSLLSAFSDFTFFFKILCKIDFLSATFPDSFSSYCFAANSQVTLKLANQWTKMCVVSYLLFYLH